MRQRSRSQSRNSKTGASLLSRRRILALLGATAIGGGAVYTGAFSSASANRGAQLNTASDANAFLGLTGYDDTSETPTFTNNTSDVLSVTLNSTEAVEFDVGIDGTYAAPPETFSLASGTPKQVNIQFDGKCTDAGSATVSTDASSSNGTISFTREWKIPDSGQVQFTGTAKSPGGSGKYEFDLENTGCNAVTFNGIGINETTADEAEFVSGGGSLEGENNTLVTQRIDFDSSDPSSDTKYDLNQNVMLPVGDTITWEFTRFQRSGRGNPNVSMENEDVKIRLYLTDGSTKTTNLCLGSCDF